MPVVEPPSGFFAVALLVGLSKFGLDEFGLGVANDDAVEADAFLHRNTGIVCGLADTCGELLGADELDLGIDIEDVRALAFGQQRLVVGQHAGRIIVGLDSLAKIQDVLATPRQLPSVHPLRIALPV